MLSDRVCGQVRWSDVHHAASANSQANSLLLLERLLTHLRLLGLHGVGRLLLTVRCTPTGRRRVVEGGGSGLHLLKRGTGGDGRRPHAGLSHGGLLLLKGVLGLLVLLVLLLLLRGGKLLLWWLRTHRIHLVCRRRLRLTLLLLLLLTTHHPDTDTDAHGTLRLTRCTHESLMGSLIGLHRVDVHPCKGRVEGTRAQSGSSTAREELSSALLRELLLLLLLLMLLWLLKGSSRGANASLLTHNTSHATSSNDAVDCYARTSSDGSLRRAGDGHAHTRRDSSGAADSTHLRVRPTPRESSGATNSSADADWITRYPYTHPHRVQLILLVSSGGSSTSSMCVLLDGEGIGVHGHSLSRIAWLLLRLLRLLLVRRELVLMLLLLGLLLLLLLMLLLLLLLLSMLLLLLLCEELLLSELLVEMACLLLLSGQSGVIGLSLLLGELLWTTDADWTAADEFMLLLLLLLLVLLLLLLQLLMLL